MDEIAGKGSREAAGQCTEASLGMANKNVRVAGKRIVQYGKR
jgi:hypothetical protein